MTMIAEAAQSERYESEQVSILTRDRIDAINVQAEGSVIVEGTEYYFVVEDGNNNGTVLRGWNDVGEKFELHQPTQWALQPQRHIIDDAIEKGGGQFLIAKWDALLMRDEIASIPGKYAYDRRVQPGIYVEGYWKKAAAKHLFDIVTKEEADATRAALRAQEERS